MVDIGLKETHRNKSENRMFDIELVCCTTFMVLNQSGGNIIC
jgi:hypothetical protein